MRVNLKIKKETEKAVLVEVRRYVVISTGTLEDLKKRGENVEILDEGRANVLVKTKPVQVWLPKSQVKIEEDKVTEVKDWLAKKKGIPHAAEEIKDAVEEEYKKFKKEQPHIKPPRMLIKKRVMERLGENREDEEAVWWFIKKMGV